MIVVVRMHVQCECMSQSIDKGIYSIVGNQSINDDASMGSAN